MTGLAAVEDAGVEGLDGLPAGWVQRVRSELSRQRWQHVLGVASLGRRLAEAHALDRHAVGAAALLHDVAREWPLERLRSAVEALGLAVDALEMSHAELLHGPAAVAVAVELGVRDGEVLTALRYHTTGRPEPGRLEMALMVADFAEPGRTHAGAEAVRAMAFQDLAAAAGQVVERRVRWLVAEGLPLHPRTVAARNWWLARG